MKIKRRKIDKNLLYSMTDEQMKEANELSKSTRALDVQDAECKAFKMEYQCIWVTDEEDNKGELDE